MREATLLIYIQRFMEKPTGPASNAGKDITLSEQDYDYIKSIYQWSRPLSILGLVFTSLFFIGILLIDLNLNGMSSPLSESGGGGYQIKKKYFLDIDVVGYLFLITAFTYWLALFYILFRSSGVAYTATDRKDSIAFTKFIKLLSRFFKLLAAGILGFILLVGLLYVLPF